VASPSRDALNRFAESAGVDWSIQDGSLQILPKDGDSQVQAAVFSDENENLISVSEKKDGIEVKAWLTPRVRPGDRFRLEDGGRTGIFKARDVGFIGDSGHSSTFQVKATAREA
ncbi:MAG: hypothetical protein ABEN55_12120, partial [Bradymonadaceae bacterium]